MSTVENDPIRKFVDDYEFLADCGNAVALTTEQKRIVLEGALHSWSAQEAEREKHAIAEAVAAEREKNLAAVERARIASDGWGDPIDDGDCERNEGIDLAIEAIRSAAK